MATDSPEVVDLSVYVKEAELLAELRGTLVQHSKAVVERTLNYLKHWNDKRPARDD